MKKILCMLLALIMVVSILPVGSAAATDLSWDGGTITLAPDTKIGSATLTTLAIYKKNNTSVFPAITNVTQEGYVINVTLAADTDPSYPIQMGFAMNGGYVQNSGNTCTLKNGQGTATVTVLAKPASAPSAPMLGQATFTVNFSVPMGTAYDVTAPTGEGFSFAGDATVYEGRDYTFKITVNEGFNGSNMMVKVNDTALDGNNGSYTVAGVTENLVITVEGIVRKQLASVVLTESEGYTITSSDLPYLGEDYTFTVAVDSAYKKENMKVLLDGETELTIDNGVYTIPALDGDHVITVVGLQKKSIYSITMPEGNGFTFAGDATIYEGDSYTFTVIPAAGLVAVVKVNGETIPSSDNTYTVSGVCADLSITVETERAPLPENELPVADNVVDITDATIYSRSNNRYYANAIHIKIGGATVTSAYEDGKTVYILLGAGTSDAAKIDIAFGTALNRCEMSGHTATYTLTNGEGTLNMTLTGSYSSNMKASATYTLIFIREEVTDIPKRLIESDTASTYTGVGLELDLSKYFEGATEYYLVDGENRTPVESNMYEFLTMQGGEHTLVFSAANKLGECGEMVSVTINVTAIESGVWIGHTTSSGSLDYVLFKDADGNFIDGVEVTYENKVISARLPKSYPIAGKVTAEFSLTQNASGYPFLSTGKDSVGASPATKYKFTTKETTLSAGAGSLTFYYFNSAPSGSNQETFKLSYKVANTLPVLSGNASAKATVEANENYALNLANLFTDADGDALTYLVSVNGAAATVADADYTFSTDVAGTYTLVFTANDGKGTSVEAYTVTLTVENSAETHSMTIVIPEDLTPIFYASTGFSDGIDQLGVCLEAVKGETADGMTAYEVKYPINAEKISVRTDNFGGMAFAATDSGAVMLRKAQYSVVDYNNQTASSTNKVTYGENIAVAGADGWLLVCGIEYIFSVVPSDNTLASAKQSVALEASSAIYTAEFTLGLNNPVSITVPTGAKAQLYKYNQYYSNTELDAKIIKDNEDGTTTYQFVADLLANGAAFIYRVSMEGRITKAGWLGWNEQNLSVTYTDNDKSPAYRLDDYSATGEENSGIAEDSVLLNVNSRNHLNLSVGENKTLKAYRAWEIIPLSYNNYIIPPDFHFEILSGADVVSLTKKASASAGDGDWKTLTALKPGIAIIEVTYDAIDIRDTGTTAHYAGVFGASDPARSGLLVVQVGENDDSSVKFGIESFTSIGTSGASNITYNPNKQKEWDAEFDTLYFLGNSGKLTLKPTASSAISAVSVSHDKGATWTSLSGENGVYTAEIVPGNNILRVSTDAGTTYQVVRGDKIFVKFDEVAESSNDNGEIEAGETVRVYLNGLHNPIPKMAGNYNPGYRGNTDGYSSQHLNYTCNGTPIYGIGAQYNFITTANYVDVVMPADGSNVELTDGYIGLGVLGLTAFFDGGDSHRNIPDNGSGTRGNQSTFHTRSILPGITVSVGDTSAPNAAPIVRVNAAAEASIYTDQKYAVNPDTLFTDPDNDTMTFTVSVNGAEAAEAPLDYKFTPSGAGTYTLLFTATDGKATAQHSIKLTVTARPAPDTPSTPTTPDVKDEFGLDKSEIAGYVTISFEDKGVRVKGESGLKYPKALGTIVPATKVPYRRGEKISHVTARLLEHLGIEMAYSGTFESGFYLGAICNFEVKGTPYDSMGEFDAGVGSGWMITLNKTFIEYGASEFTVKNGDVIRWQYTCQLGKDIGDPFYSGSSSSSSSNKNNKTEDEKKEDKVEIKEETTKNTFTESTFTDIKKDDWHYASVKYVYENNLMQGTGSGFEPESKMTRAMLVTILYRMANPEEIENTHSFTDVAEDQWYSDAIAWAAANGIVSGITSTEFAPDSDISREQMALIIYRFAKVQGIDVSAKADISAFTDTDEVSDWAHDAICWANDVNLVNGTSETTLSPKTTATRAQVAAILMRFCENVTK